MTGSHSSALILGCRDRCGCSRRFGGRECALPRALGLRLAFRVRASESLAAVRHSWEHAVSFVVETGARSIVLSVRLPISVQGQYQCKTTTAVMMRARVRESNGEGKSDVLASPTLLWPTTPNLPPPTESARDTRGVLHAFDSSLSGFFVRVDERIAYVRAPSRGLIFVDVVGACQLWDIQREGWARRDGGCTCHSASKSRERGERGWA